MLFKSFILAGTVQGVFLIILLLAGKRNRSTYLLITWLAILSVQLLFYYDNLSDKPVATRWISLWAFALPLLGSPFLYLYFYSLSLKPKRIWPHVLPYAAYCLILLMMPVTAVSGGYPHFAASVPDGLANGLYYVLAILPGVYALFMIKELWSLQKHLALSFIFLFTGLFALIRFGAPTGLISYPELFALVGASLALYIFYIGYRVLRPPTKAAYQHSGLGSTQAEGIFAQLSKHMKEAKPFLNADLTLDELAIQIGVSPHQLSQAINQQGGTNFFLLVNTYRVEVIKERLRDPAYASFSILGIAKDGGFKSKSTFNKIFKEITGETPSAYQNKGLSLPVRTS
jgi:AraC-like DNA-binding protein